MRRCRCGGDSTVVDSRTDARSVTRRRRRCRICGHRWSTIEVADAAGPTRRSVVAAAARVERMLILTDGAIAELRVLARRFMEEMAENDHREER